MTTVKKYLDWKGYFEGLYLSWIKTLSATFLAYIGSNAAQSMGVPSIALSWQQALGMAGSITVVEVLRYLNAKPKPDTLTMEETSDTQFTTTTTKTTVTDKQQP